MEHRIFGEKVEGISYFDREGAYLLCVQEGKAAVIETQIGYFLIGGGMEPGETKEECLRREILEETGFEAGELHPVCSAEEFWLNHETLGNFHPIQYYFSGELIKKKGKPTEKEECLVWISVSQWPEKLKMDCQSWAAQQYLKSFIESQERTGMD